MLLQYSIELLGRKMSEFLEDKPVSEGEYITKNYTDLEVKSIRVQR